LEIVAGPKVFFIALGGPQAHDHSGRPRADRAASGLHASWDSPNTELRTGFVMPNSASFCTGVFIPFRHSETSGTRAICRFPGTRPSNITSLLMGVRPSSVVRTSSRCSKRSASIPMRGSIFCPGWRALRRAMDGRTSPSGCPAPRPPVLRTICQIRPLFWLTNHTRFNAAATTR
jgi:hypothetical protein